MYSLTKATELLITHYNLGSIQVNNDVLKYNTHKVRHSNGVLETGRNLIIKINENLYLNNKTINKIEISLLLHDIARFYQNNKIRVLKNSEFEHGDEGYEILKQENYDEQICLAVKYHNKYDLSLLYLEETFLSMNIEEKKETEIISKILRDADKLQNMIYTIFNINELSNIDGFYLENNGISKEILDDLKNKIQVDRKNIKTNADYTLSYMCWMFDINFKESIEMLNYYGFFEKLVNYISKLPGVKSEDIKILQNIFLNK